MSLTPYFPPTYFSASYFVVNGQPIEDPTGPTTGRTPYQTPAYFAPAYFAGLTPTSSLPLVGRTPYQAPSYFPAAYFYGQVVADSQPSPVVVRALVGRDGGAYADLLATLERAREFASVRFGDPSERNLAGADATPRAVVIPQGWEESDETDPTLLVRRTSFVVRLTILVGVDHNPFDELDRLARVVQDRVDRSDLGGECLAGLTRIRGGRYQVSDRYPEWSVDLDGEFSTLIELTSG